jgi:hypothetical protein
MAENGPITRREDLSEQPTATAKTTLASEAVGPKPVAPLSVPRWTTPTFWLTIGGCLSCLIGFGMSGFLAWRLQTRSQTADLGDFLFLASFHGLWLTGAAGIFLFAPFLLWKAIDDERNHDMWRVRAANRRYWRAEQERQEQALRELVEAAEDRRNEPSSKPTDDRS